jgi:predicted RNA-binding Zn-ribbon protein involved in translation (DUF1610 family)
MLTIDNVKSATRRYWTAAYVTSAVLIALLLLNGTIARSLVDPLSALGVHIKSQTLTLAIMAMILALFAGVLVAVQRRYLPKCPACSKKIYPNSVGVVIATKHCPNCGVQIISQGS